MKQNSEDGYQQKYNNRRICGVWLIMVGIVLIIATVFGSTFMVNPIVFMAGYFISFFFVYVRNSFGFLSEGSYSAEEAKMTKVSLCVMFILMFILGGPHFITMNWRMIWLGALLATSIHFFPFSCVHGKTMILLGLICTIISIVGMFFVTIPFLYLGIMYGFFEIVFGLLFLTRT